MSEIEKDVRFIDEESEENGDQAIEEYSESRIIYVDKKDPEITSLYDSFKDGDLILQPEFQRRYVWDAQKASRLIESVLLGVPLPIIYLSEEQDGTKTVIDGQQRLTSFFNFLDGKHPDGRDFKLSGLRVLKNLASKKYSELDKRHQSKIKKYGIPVVTFQKSSDSELKFEVFERLNTGAVALNDQELRNFIYRSEYNNLLKELAKYEEYRTNLSLYKEEPRMKDVEYVLRFAAFFFTPVDRYKPPMKRFLNLEMESRKNISQNEINNLVEAFKKANWLIRSVFGDNAFKKFKKDENGMDGDWEKKVINSSLYDILMYGFAVSDKNVIMRHSDLIREALIDMMVNDQEFVDSIEKSTSSSQAVKVRFSKWMNKLNEITKFQENDPRCFSYEFKRKLFGQDDTCAICGNKILTLDDAAVDHIEQYHLGGSTTEDNARLTHRYCNLARSRKE